MRANFKLYKHLITGYINLILVGMLVSSCGPEDTQTQNLTISVVTKVTLTATSEPTKAIVINTAAAISVPQTSTPTTPLTVPVNPNTTWQDRWIKGLPCNTPCFEGIIPGKTTATEALTILEQNPYVAAARMYKTLSSKIPIGEVMWDWINGRRGTGGFPDGGGRAFFDPTSSTEIIMAIDPVVTKPIKITDIINVYGEPSHIGAGFNRNVDGTISYGIFLLYSPQGFVLFNPSSETKPQIDNNLTFVRLSLFVPGISGFKQAYPDDEYAHFVPWQGFNTFDFYCRTTEKNIPETCTKKR